VPNAQGQTTACYYSAWTNWANAGSCTAAAQSTGSPYSVLRATACRQSVVNGTSDTMADVAAYYYCTDLRTGTPASSADTTGTCTGPVIAPSTTANNLCTATDVPVNGLDSNPKQHMNFYGLSLGAQGEMVYSQYQNERQRQTRIYAPSYWDQAKRRLLRA
jgi:type IV pilus assembly protein PilY1